MLWFQIFWFSYILCSSHYLPCEWFIFYCICLFIVKTKILHLCNNTVEWMNGRKPESLFSSSVSLVCIPCHLCHTATWLSDVWKSLILRLPLLEELNYATETHTQKSGSGMRYLWQDILRWVSNLTDFKEDPSYYMLLKVFMLHHSLVLPVGDLSSI